MSIRAEMVRSIKRRLCRDFENYEGHNMMIPICRENSRRCGVRGRLYGNHRKAAAAPGEILLAVTHRSVRQSAVQAGSNLLDEKSLALIGNVSARKCRGKR
jgi:hypothetical protein